ncbi:MAG: (5-formylfuran-3-yl)methyl phosphate synthase [Alphaproteobacteria bacterium]|nr:(5-formylfuran-3-yl)methyl phosphate synthase [Alphaproteobacteria bacterium]
MTAFLASVATLDEMEIAFGAGVDILDLKNPALGALGAWDTHDLIRAVAFIGGRTPVSATIGDLPMEPEPLAAAVAATAATGVDFVKVGFFAENNGDGDAQLCAQAIGNCERGAARLVAVLFADQSPDFSLLGVLAANGFSGVMLDTADKTSGGLRHHLEDHRLARFVEDAAARGMFSGLAGSLALGDALPLLELGPDYLGFRGALCGAQDRRGALDPHALAQLVTVFQDWNASRPSQATATAGAQAAAFSPS